MHPSADHPGEPAGVDPVEEYAAAVLALARQIPSGRAMTYGLIAEIVAETLHRGGPRQVGQVMAGTGGRYAHLVPDGAAVVGPVQDTNRVPWWRVVNASGAPPPHLASAALDALRAEGAPLTRDGTRVALRRAIWYPGIAATDIDATDIAAADIAATDIAATDIAATNIADAAR